MKTFAEVLVILMIACVLILLAVFIAGAWLTFVLLIKAIGIIAFIAICVLIGLSFRKNYH